ncbi:MAG TPA: DNA cytosine methyltransferase, partial [Terriglobales bacterium]
MFAGIGGFDLGFERAGFKVAWQVEKEPFCRKVLEARFPESLKFDDVKECGKHNLGAVDVLTAGFPCQDLSVAGKR